jgi:ubiquinone/menaquinone biosynthesis C-methylase UbiE
MRTPEIVNEQYYDSIADKYEQYDGNRKHHKWIETLIKQFSRETNGGHFLDVCAGTGYIAKIATKYFKQVTAIDISSNMLSTIKNKHIDVIKLSAYDIDKVWKNHFDCITCFAGLHHLDAQSTLIKKAHTALCKGGIFYSDHDLCSQFYDRYKLIIEAKRALKLFYIPEYLWELHTKSETCNFGIKSKFAPLWVHNFSKQTVVSHWQGFLPIPFTFKIGYAPYVRIIATK